MLSRPSASHLLGTDTLGRDVLSRLLYGITPVLQNSLIALVVFLVSASRSGSSPATAAAGSTASSAESPN